MQCLKFFFSMEEIPCTVHLVKLIRLLADKTSGCGVFDVTFPTAAGVKVSDWFVRLFVRLWYKRRFLLSSYQILHWW